MLRTPRKDKVAMEHPKLESEQPKITKAMVAKVKKELKLTEAEMDVQQVKELAKALVTDPLYLTMLQRRMREGKLPPAVEVTLWYYAFGKPKEQIEVKKASVVKILHEYADQVDAGKLASSVVEVEVLKEEGVLHGESGEDAMEPTTDSVPEE
jgi:hypothetical protein